MVAIRKSVERWKLTQADAAKTLHLTQPRMNDLPRGRIDKFSLDALTNVASAVGLFVQVKVKKAT